MTMVETIKIEHNYTDRLIIEKTNEKYLYSKQNDKYGIEYENSIVTKSYVNLGIKPINDPNIVTDVIFIIIKMTSVTILLNKWMKVYIKLFLFLLIIIK